MPLRARLLAFSMWCVAPQLLQGQRELHWRSIGVEARFDGEGTLHVRERQVMVFTGDWNGGERSFNIRLGQKFTFERMLRVDPTTGAEQEMSKGDLDGLHHYSWAGNNTLRWRSRQTTDPPFDATELTYILEYSLSNILIPRDESYLLDHDFAFGNRTGDIEQFTLSLSLDDAWRAPPSFTGRYGPVRLAPGDGYVVTIPLGYRYAGRPAGVVLGASAPPRYALAAILIAALVLLGTRFTTSERASGRFAPLLSASAIDEAWLKEHVFEMLPEVVGAAWDDTTGAPEVAAVLARMVAEKKLGSRVETPKVLIFSRNVLHLSLLVPRSDLSGYELSLVNALFTPASNETDTDAVRKRYSSSGFDPASKIKQPLEQRVKVLGGRSVKVEKPSRRPTFILFVTAIVLAVLAGIAKGSDALVVGSTSAVVLVLYGFSAIQARLWRNRVQGWTGHSLRFVLPMSAATAGILGLIITGSFRLGAFGLAALVTLCLTTWNSVLNLARTRQAPELIALRKQLAAAREYFRKELRKSKPSLRDDWFPYLMAFGLGPQMDRWFHAFSGASTGISPTSMSQSSGGFSSGSGDSWTGFGGGGGFSGGGSSGAWAAAVGTMAAGVAAPSSSSSGGGSSGGGSSGGGGGGGW